jgi:hypothetical protein
MAIVVVNNLIYYSYGLHIYLIFAPFIILAISIMLWNRERLIRSRVSKLAVIKYSALPEIAAVVSHGDRAVAEAITEYTKDHFAYFKEHCEEFVKPGIKSEELISREKWCWVFVVDQLVKNQYAAAIGCNPETEAILYNLGSIVKKLQFPTNIDDLVISNETTKRSRSGSDADGLDTRFALHEISTELEACGYALGNIAIYGDYVLILTEIENKDKLMGLAAKFGCSIHFDF